MWHDLTDKTIGFPSKSTTVLVTNKNLDCWEPNKYSLIQVDKLLNICNKPYCTWTHWMQIPEIPEINKATKNIDNSKYVDLLERCGITDEKIKEYYHKY